jgi:hypothetical protein
MKELKKEFVNKFIDIYKHNNGSINSSNLDSLNFDLCCEDSGSQQEEVESTRS